MKRMLSGIKPTGPLTLGNYIGALKNFVEYQNEYEMFTFIANLHCITCYQKPEELRKNLMDAVALYLACGLDPEKSVIFLQTDVPAHAELGYILACNTYMGELNRMTQFKEKCKENESVSAGMFTYPSLMAADILLYNPDYVPVGDDQKQHVELTRDIAVRFNHLYGNTFRIPESLTQKIGGRIMSLQDPSKKMSKSDRGDNKGCIFLLDDPAVARKKIMSAVTDSYNHICLDPENQPGIYNLIEIASSITGRTMESIAEEYENQSYGTFKKYVADAVCEKLSQIQSRYRDIMESGQVYEVLKKGAEKANAEAEKTLETVRKKTGILLERQDLKVVDWTNWDYSKRSETVSDDDFKEAFDAVVKDVREHNYHFDGDYHQNGEFGCPLMNNGKKFSVSLRTWGDVMAKAYPEEFDNPNDPMNYVRWYLGPSGKNGEWKDWSKYVFPEKQNA